MSPSTYVYAHVRQPYSTEMIQMKKLMVQETRVRTGRACLSRALGGLG